MARIEFGDIEALMDDLRQLGEDTEEMALEIVTEQQDILYEAQQKTAESMLQGIDKCLAKINAIRRNPNATAKEEDLLTTLEAVYEFYRRGFTFAPIDIYKSDSYKFLIEDGCLRPPFVAISGLGGSAAEDLKRAQDSGAKFVSIDDISDACPKVSTAHLDMLRKLGALGDLPETRQVSLFDAFGEM